jgi:hypothetical protein
MSEHTIHITVSKVDSLLSGVVPVVREEAYAAGARGVAPTKKKIKFIVKRRAAATAATAANREELHELFKTRMNEMKHHEVWKFKQTSKQKHTRTRLCGKGEPVMFRDGEKLELGSKGTEPLFTIEFGVRKGSSHMNWLTKDKFKEDYFKLLELGDPMVPQNQGGLKWQDILEHIYNSGEMEELRQKNGFDPKLKQDVFFPSGKTDSGRTISQFLNRLWFIVNRT